MSKKGISLISLIITVIVVIILAAIAIFSGFKAVEEAELAKFVHEVSEFETAAQHDYLNRQTNLRVSGVNEKKEITYSKIAGGDDTPSAELNVADIVTDENARAKYNGDKCYLVTDTANIANWTTPKNFTGRSDETIYLTNQGEVIITPGLTIKKDNGEEVTYYNATNSTEEPAAPSIGDGGGNTDPNAPAGEPGSLLNTAKVGDYVRITYTTEQTNERKIRLSSALTGRESDDWSPQYAKPFIKGQVVSRNPKTGEMVLAANLCDSPLEVKGKIALERYDELIDMIIEMHANPNIGMPKENIRIMTLEDMKSQIANWDEVMADFEAGQKDATYTEGTFFVDGEWKEATEESPLTIKTYSPFAKKSITWADSKMATEYKNKSFILGPQLFEDTINAPRLRYAMLEINYNSSYKYHRVGQNNSIFYNPIDETEGELSINPKFYITIDGNKAKVQDPNLQNGGSAESKPWKVQDV